MITGRLGHARVVVLCVTENEAIAVKETFGAHTEVQNSGVYAPAGTLEAPGAKGMQPILPVIVARCEGRSNMPAMASTHVLLERWRPEFIILCGTAGGIRRGKVVNGRRTLEGPSLGDVVIAELVHYADYGKTLQGAGFRPRYMPAAHPPPAVVQHAVEPYLTADRRWPEPLLRLSPNGVAQPPPRVHAGEIVAVEAVQGDPTNTHQQWLVSHFDKALCVDMESFGVARAIHSLDSDVHYHARWLCVRGVSDLVVGSEEDLAEGANDNNQERRLWEAFAAHNAAFVARAVAERLLSHPRPAHPRQPGAPAWN